ncbi:MAG: acyltransferase [Hyphomicrobiales bacterium]|nr:acyltransferase [Hyphomicrobiales bacterium]
MSSVIAQAPVRPQSPSSVKLHYIQALRGLAATLVLFDHILTTLIKYGDIPASYAPLFARLGGVGVSIFFVISGFIMMHMEGEGGHAPQAARTFLLKRIIRIAPVYWLATALSFVLLVLVKKPEPPIYLAKSLLFIPYFSSVEQAMYPVVAQGWTLNYEMVFYLAFAAAMMAPGRLGFLALTALFGALAALGATGIFGPTGNVGATVMGFYADPIILLFPIGMGVALAQRRWPRLFENSYPMLVAIGLVALDIMIFANASLHENALATLTTFAISIASVGVCAMHGGQPVGWSSRLWEMLGDSSYSLYLFHTLVLAVLNRTLDAHGLWRAGLYISTAFIVATGVAYAIYGFIEKPVTERLRRSLLA